MEHSKKNTSELLKIAKENNDLVRLKPLRPRKKLELTLPLCPSVNHAYKHVRGRKIMTKEALNFIQTAQTIAQREKAKQKYEIEPLGVWMVLEVTYYFPDRLRRDTHNLHKVLADALEGEAYVDDRYLLIRDIYAGLDTDNPRMEVTLKCL